MTTNEIPIRLARVLFAYDPKTGELRWATEPGRCRRIGKEVGNVSGKHRITSIGNVRFKVHRICWSLYYDEQPPEFIDHINGDGRDNRIENLRAITNRQNTENVRKPRTTNRLGILGISRKRGKFRARIMVAGREISLGVFATPEEASEAYLSAKAQLHDGFVPEPLARNRFAAPARSTSTAAAPPSSHPIAAPASPASPLALLTP